MPASALTSEVSRYIWDLKYRYRDGDAVHDDSIEQTWRRVSEALAAGEKKPAFWAEQFQHILQGFHFLPAGRILAGAGTRRHVTLANCFVMGTIDDSMAGIFSALQEGALTMQQGGGVGYDFSTLRPAGSPAVSAGTMASGPVSFMQIWDAMCATLLSSGHRRGAMMATLRCDHPDIETFIDAKRDARQLRHFNLSVLVSDAFMQAVADDDDWPLCFPLGGQAGDKTSETLQRHWSGHDRPVPCRVYRRVSARELWQRIIQANYDMAEPGVLFIDRINTENNLAYCETITATNPCGEVPLPAYGACNLGSINLTRFVTAAFTEQAGLDMPALEQTVRTAVRLLDNVIDVSKYPLPRQQQQAHNTRRLGLGVTGLADCFMMLGLGYDSSAARDLAADLMQRICYTAYRTSCQLAREKGAFPLFVAEHYLRSPFIQRLPDDIRQQISRDGIRNSHLIAIAPTGTISLLANNISSSLEPVFAEHYARNILTADGQLQQYTLTDYALQLWRDQGHQDLPPAFITARQLKPETHLTIQASLQPFVDNAISKTINVPEDFPREDFESLYLRAYELGLKGCTTFRPNEVTGSVLAEEDSSHCCSLVRESD